MHRRPRQCVSPAKNRSLTSSAACGSRLRQLVERFVEGQQHPIRPFGHLAGPLIDNPVAASPPPCFARRFATGLLDQNPPHRLGGRRKEVPATVPVLDLAPYPPAGCTPHAPAPWPAASGPAFPGPSWQRPASAVPRRPAAGAARRPTDRPDSICDRICVTSHIGIAPEGRMGHVIIASPFPVRHQNFGCPASTGPCRANRREKNLRCCGSAKSQFYPLPPSHSTSACVCLWGGVCRGEQQSVVR